ncbi:hypothetical protein [Elizabethkingia anophelis]|uniref:hypothetical protein n=1 Tax=Elizabethkingia anophelis TaxID=1117645 RepID=UPI003891395B
MKSSKLLGTAGEVSGKAAPWLEVGINVYSYKNGLVGTGEFLYDMLGTGTSVYVGGEVGTAFGGPAGFVAGSAVGVGFEGTKYITNKYIIPAYKKIEYKVLNPVINKFRNAALHGYRYSNIENKYKNNFKFFTRYFNECFDRSIDCYILYIYF